MGDDPDTARVPHSSVAPAPIDLRSDTVTLPSPAMRRAMAGAVVGDDVLDGDPTTGELERRVAALLGHEAALFFPTGTQANQVAIGLHTRPGGEIILDGAAHIVHYEKSGAAAIWGVQLRPVISTDGRVSPDAVAEVFRGPSVHLPDTQLLCVENTHNAAGGTVSSVELIRSQSDFAASHGIPLHLDGARLWNATVALGVDPRHIASPATTVMVSFTKGLGCPVGSCLAGPISLMDRAVELRRRLGGGMRQSGVLAAACLYALEHNVSRLADDHHNARLLGDALTDHSCFSVQQPETNIVMIDLEQGTAFDAQRALAGAGVLLSIFGPRRLRAVTHEGISSSTIDRAAMTIRNVLS